MEFNLTLEDVQRQREEERLSPIRQNSFLTKDVPDPDAAAENRKMASSLGMDPFFVDRNHEQVREMYTTQGLIESLSGAPGVTRYLRDVNNFAISKDDVPALTGLEKLLVEGSPSHAPRVNVPIDSTAVLSGVQKLYDPTDKPELREGALDTKALKMFYYNLRATIPRIASGMLSNKRAALYRLTQPKPEGEAEPPSDTMFLTPNVTYLLKLKEIAQANPDLPTEEIQRLASIETPKKDTMSFLRVSMIETLKKDIVFWQSIQYDPDYAVPKEFETPETWFQSLMASAGGTAGGMGAFIVNPLLGLGLMNVEMAGRKSEQYLEEGIDPITANRAAYLYSILSTPVEFAGDKLQIGRLAKILKGGTLARFAKNVGVAGMGEGTEEWVQILPEAIADTYARHPDWTWGQIVTVGAEEARRRMFSSEGAQTALMGAAVGTLFAGAAGAVALPAQLKEDQRRADWVEKDKETLAAMDKTVEDLKTKLRMEGKTEEAIEAILEENPEVETHVYFPADRLTELFQDDVKEARRAFEAMGVTPEEVAEKAELGADVAVPVGTYVAKVAGTDLAAKLANDRRLAKDGMTPNQFKDWQKAVAEETKEIIDQLKGEVKVYTEWGKQVKAVFTDVRDNLAAAEKAVGTGLETAANNAYAFAAAISTIAKRNNQTPMQVYEKFKPEIVAGIYAGAQAQGEGVLNQDGPAPTFFSQLEKTVEAKLPGKGTATQLAQAIEGWATKGEFKKEELEWIGVSEWLKGLPEGEKVTKQQVMDFVRAGGVRLEEVKKGTISQEEYDSFEAPLLAPTKYENYQMEGEKTGYRELLMTMSAARVPQWFIAYKGGATIGSGFGNKAEAEADAKDLFSGRDDIEIRQGYDDRSTTTKTPENFIGSHWDEPNVLAHIRFNERTDADGKRVLFIEEIQSDWHQAGRKKGYYSPETVSAIRNEIKSKYGVKEDFGSWSLKLLDQYGVDETLRQKWWDSSMMDQYDKVPNAPFKASSSWAMLAMKRMIRYAAENGFERIAWTPGEVQAERYDLSKQVDSINYYRKIKNGERRYVIFGKKDGLTILEHPTEGATPEKDLENVVGKDLAAKIIASQDDQGEFSGVDLKVGGEGMKGFYDKILPAEVGKYIKKWGAKVGETKIEAGEKISKTAEPVTLEDYGANRLPGERIPDYVKRKLSEANLKPVHSFDLTPAMVNSVMAGQPLFQDPKSPRASFQFSTKTGKPLITLFQTANESSFLHETGHLYLEMIQYFAHQGTASKDFMDDWRIIQKEFGLDDSGAAIPEEVHEKFAEGLVNYFAEGKAPNSSLRGVFHRFAKWLSALAKELSGTYQPSEELKGVFDRLYASERDIAAAESVRGKKETLLDALKMTDKEAEAYKKLQTRATMTSEEKRLAALLKARAAARLKLEGGRKGLAKKIEADLLQEPLYAAIEDVRASGLNRTAAKEFLDQKEINALSKRLGKGLKEDTEVTPDALALKHGYPDPETMLRDMLAAPAKAEVIQKRLDARIQEIENEAANGPNEQGETLNGERDYHSPERLSLLLAEVQMLEDKLNSLRKTPRKITDSAAQVQALRELAEEKLSEAKVSDAISYRAHSRAELKARKLSEKAMKKGDFAEAARQKNREAINHAYVLEAVKLREWHSRAVTAMRRSANQQSLTDEARNLIGDIVHRFGVVRVARQSVAESTAAYRQGKTIIDADKWAEAVKSEGHSVAVPDLVSGKTTEDYRTLPISVFREITEFVKSVKQVDKKRREVTYQGKRMKTKAVVEKLSAALGSLEEWRTEDAAKVGTIKKGLQEGDAFLMRVEVMCKRMDRYVDGGPWWTAIFLPMAEARKAKMALLGPDSDALTKLFNSFSLAERLSMKKENISVPGIKNRISKWKAIMVLLHSGTESTYYSRLLDGENWTEAQVQAIIDTLSEKEVRFAEAIWAINESHWNDVKALQERTGNTVPAKLAPREVQTRFGVLKGGYFPAKADSERSAVTARGVDDVALATGLLKSVNPAHAMTKQGHAKERAAGPGGRRLSFDPITIVQHLNEVTHDLGYREAIMDVSKLLNYAEYEPTERGGSRKVFPVQEMIKEALGKPYLDSLTRWLVDVANNGGTGPLSPVAKLGRLTRLGTIMVKMGFKMTTIAMQPLGVFPGMTTVKGAANKADLLKRFVSASGLRHARELVERFPFLRDRMYSHDRNVYDFIHSSDVKGAARSKIDKISMYLVSAAQFYTVDCPLFEAAYAARLKETGGDEKLAEQLAESDVRLTQGSGLLQDLPDILRGGEARKLITTFANFSNVFWNLARMNVSKLKMTRDVPAFMAFLFLGWFIPSVLAPYMAGRGQDWDDEDWDKWIALQILDYPMQSIPLVGDLGSRMLPGLLDLDKEKYDIQPTPAWAMVEAGERWIDLFGDLVHGEKGWEDMTEPTIDIIGYGLRLPTDQPSITLGNIMEFLSGEDSEFYVRDLFFKKPPERR